MPRSYKEAIIHPENHDRWLPAMKKEVDKLVEKGTWCLVPRPKDYQVLPGRWFFVEKHREGTKPLAKARWVTRGDRDHQHRSVDELYAAVAHQNLVRVFITLVAVLDFEWKKFDIVNAFVNAEVGTDGIIYVQQPHGIADGTDRECLLKMAL